MSNIKRTLQPPARLGIIGGGQLGRMLTMEAKRLGYDVIVLDPQTSSPAGQLADNQIKASFSDRKAIRKLSKLSDAVTFEFEHINADVLCDLASEGYAVYPSGNTLKKIQNKFIQKRLLESAGLPVPQYCRVNSVQEIKNALDRYRLPVVLKACSGGYDGKGNYVVRDILPGCLASEIVRFEGSLIGIGVN